LSQLLASAGHDDQPTGWSNSELDRVSEVIRRVSMSADSPNIQSIVKQLQIELTKLKGEMLTQHTILEGVTAERAEVAQRLLEVENQVQNAASILQKKLKEAEQQSEARIEAEITAVRQCVDRLADHKEILKQRRLVTEERLIRMDAEVAAEVASMNARRMDRVTGAGAVNRQLLAAADGSFGTKITIPTTHTEDKAPSPSDNPCSHFKLPSQPLQPSTECPFFAPNPVRTPFSRPLKDSNGLFYADKDKIISSSKPHSISAFSAFKPANPLQTDILPEAKPISNFKNTLPSSSKDPLPGSGGARLLPLSLDLNNDNVDYDDYGGDNNFGGCDNDTSVYHEDIITNDENTCPVSTKIPLSTDTNMEKSNVRKYKNTSADSVLKQQKHEVTNEQNSEHKNEKKSSISNRNTVNYYGNLKFIPLKVKSTKPRPIEAKVCVYLNV
jgi:hypothetical protein